MTEEQPKAEPKAELVRESGFAKASKEVKAMLEGYRPQLLAALPKHISVDRMIRIALTEGQRPEIMKCHRGSFLAAVLQSCQLGLELGMGLGHAYLVPFWNNKSKRDEVQLIPGYRGLVHLIRQSGMIEKFEARIVYERDTFDISYGIADSLIHRPYIERPNKRKTKRAPGPGAVIGAYAIARYKGGEPQSEWMPVLTLDAIRARSKAATRGPWVTDYEEMCRKTVAKRLAKWLPMSPEVARAIDLDNKHEAGEPQDLPVDVTALPDVALIETPDPVIETFGTGGEEPEPGSIVDTEYDVPPTKPIILDEASGVPLEVVTAADVAIGPHEETVETGTQETLLGPSGPVGWMAGHAHAEHSDDPGAKENRFSNLLASMDDSEDFADLERRTYRALTAAGENKAWQAQVKAASKKLLKKFPPPSDTTRG